MPRRLDPIIADTLKSYGFGPDACWDCHGVWVVYHRVLERIAAQASIKFDPPMIVEANGGNKIAAVCVTGHLKDNSEWSIGEAAPANNKNAYPWAMAEKRGKDRVILKLIGLHGLAYSEDEAEDFKAKDQPATESKNGNPPGISKFRAEQREFYREMRACSTMDEYTAFTATPEAQSLIAKAQREFPKEWLGDGGDIAGMKGEMQKFVDELKAPPPSEGEQPHPIPVPDGKTDKERWTPWCKALLAKIDAGPADEIDAWVKENAIPMDTLKIESPKTHAWLKEKIEAIRMGPVAA